MPSNIELLSDEEKTIIAAYYQEQERLKYGTIFRSMWVFQEDFLSYDLVSQFFDPHVYIYVKEKDNSLVLSEVLPPRNAHEIDLNKLMDHRKYLKWEPKFHPDGNPYYDSRCFLCAEGLPNASCECLGCGFSNEMVRNKDYEVNVKIIEEYYSRLDALQIS